MNCLGMSFLRCVVKEDGFFFIWKMSERLVAVRSAKPSIAQQRVEDNIKVAERPVQGATGHLNPTVQQYNALVRQTRRRSVVPKDELWAVVHQTNPSFLSHPPSLLSAPPVMDAGVSNDLHLLHTRDRKRALKLRDRSLQTHSAAYAIEDVQRIVVGDDKEKGVPCGKDRFDTTSKLSQLRVLSAAAASAEALGSSRPSVGRRLMPERATTTIAFGATSLENEFLALQASLVAEKATRHRPWSTMVSDVDAPCGAGGDRSGTPQQINVHYASRSATSLGNGLQPTGPNGWSSVGLLQRPESQLAVTRHNLTRSPFDQESAVCRKERDLEFSRVRRLPRPSNQLKEEAVVLCLR